MTFERQKIETILLEEEMKNSYMDYSMSVITNRALPDIRDGLKPSNRRILVAMNDLGLNPGKGYRKCAKIAGDTSGNYHPHGEQIVYPTLVRMAQNFNMRYPLVDGQGNFGSVDGDGAAAMRYTEARLTPIAVEILDDLKKETVNFVENYDGTRKEPTVLPGKFPNLLCNGTSGIAVGMATNIPPHNLNEISEAIIRVIENPECTNDDLIKLVPGPDFPTGGLINGRDGIYQAYTTGKGHIPVRARVAVEHMKNGKDAIIVTEIPYQVNKSNLLEKIADLVRDKRIEGISDLRDESDRDGMRIMIELKRDQQAEVILNQLYKHTTMQTTFSVNMLGLDHGVPKLMSLKQLLELFVDHRHEVITRRTKYDLRKAEERAHILEGYRIALDNIDAIIQLIKKSKDTHMAHAGLMKNFKLSDKQATAILEMRLQRLTGLERKKIEEEYHELIKKISELKAILDSKALRMQIIKEETESIATKFKDERRTEIQEATEDLTVEDLIAEEEMVITISHLGYVKRMSVTSYRKQQRGGMGSRGTQTKDDDFAEHLFIASTHDYILFFSSKGHCYWVKVHSIPTGGKLAKGKPIVNLCKMERNESITAFCKVRDFSPDEYVVMSTRKGVIKKVRLDAFSHPRANGIIAMNVPKGDELIEASLTDGTYEIVLATRLGMAIRFNEGKVRAMGRNAYGVKGINLSKGDRVIGMMVVKRNSSLLVITENGYGKRTSIDDYRITNRGGKGVINIKTSERNGEVVAIKEVLDDDELILITKHGIANRQAVKQINVIGRNTQGVRLITLREDDLVTDVARVAKEE
ncbi:MAG: DNA gyrase subunit A [candidate division Zixibacteria bacterium]|nr:DNA gyrase subunit A [candidate division Zixibacteria bacterium]